MKRIYARKQTLRMGLIFLACSGWSHAATLVVGKNPSVCRNPAYTTIGAAIAAAAPDDEIEVCPGLYPEQLVITQSVRLRGIGGNGYQRVLIQPATMTNVQNPLPAGAPFQAVISVINTNNVTIQKLP